MAYWLYQMSSGVWKSGLYRAEVWEREHTNWQIGRKVPAKRSPEPGDILVFFYAPAGESDPGVYGWATVIRFDAYDGGYEVRFIPSPPSDYLKMNPAWDDNVKVIIDGIRGRMAKGTLWGIPENLFKDLRRKIAQHVYGAS